jgi:hypothetical protein
VNERRHPSRLGLPSGISEPYRLSAGRQAEAAPWGSGSTTATDCTFHQIAPYIGRIKTTIARYLIEQYTEAGDLVIDPFCGSGVIPLEASLLGRRAVAVDINPYGVLLTRAKLTAPACEADALLRLRRGWERALRRVGQQDLRRVPRWVRSFFHPTTLRHALALRDELVEKRDSFLLACLLGILHHQRPGFLSYPSSHLVPYLRDRLFPPDQFPELYEERDVYSRMEAKVRRTFRRPPGRRSNSIVIRCDSRRLKVPSIARAIITSPPYMNELDYVRDNRLRLWFLERELPTTPDIPKRGRERRFRDLMYRTMVRLGATVAVGGAIALVVGDVSRGSHHIDSAEVILSLFRDKLELNEFKLARMIDDSIPDVRRSRRDLRGTKKETILVFERCPPSRAGR